MGRILGLQSTGTPLCASAITSPDVGSTCVGKHRGEGAGCDMLETEVAMHQQLQLQQLTCKLSSVGHGLDSKSGCCKLTRLMGSFFAPSGAVSAVRNAVESADEGHIL